jgi:hypothetical protein
VFLFCLLCRNRSECLWSRRARFRWCRCCHTLLRWTLRRCSDRCTWCLCILGQASGNSVHGLFSLHGHYWDLVTILPRLVVYSTRINCLSPGRRLRWHVSPFYSQCLRGLRSSRVRPLSCALSAVSCTPQPWSWACLICLWMPFSHVVLVFTFAFSQRLSFEAFWKFTNFHDYSLKVEDPVYPESFFRFHSVNLFALDRSTPQRSGSVEISRSYGHKMAAGTQFSPPVSPAMTGFVRMFTVTGLLCLHDGILFVSLCLFVQKL